MKCEQMSVDKLDQSSIKKRIAQLQEERFLFDWEAALEKERTITKTLPPLPIPTGIRTRERIIELYKIDINRETEYLLKKLRRLQKRKHIKKGQITGEHIAQAKQVDIRGMITFNRAGFAQCLWHNEKTPSMKYNKKTNTVHCFGCNKNADAIDVFIEQHKPILFLDAVRAMISINP